MLSDIKEVLISMLSDDTNESLLYKELPYDGKKVYLIIAYSPQYATYQKKLRELQVALAEKLIDSGKTKKETS